MPMRWFRCPDGVRVETSECLAQCRLDKRCLTRTTLQVIANGDNRWDGVPHVTQLLNGTMLEYLRISRDYVVDPRDRAFTLLGSTHHKLLEQHEAGIPPLAALEQYGMVSELALNNGWVQGTLDLLEAENEELVLTDHKTWGSGKLSRGDFSEATMQLNMYRVMVKEQYGCEVTRMQVQCTVRDGGTATARRSGVAVNMLLLPIQELPDGAVLGYFKGKANALREVLENRNMLPMPCNDTEHWHYVRCRGYCEVAGHCPVGISQGVKVEIR